MLMWVVAVCLGACGGDDPPPPLEGLGVYLPCGTAPGQPTTMCETPCERLGAQRFDPEPDVYSVEGDFFTHNFYCPVSRSNTMLSEHPELGPQRDCLPSPDSPIQPEEDGTGGGRIGGHWGCCFTVQTGEPAPYEVKRYWFECTERENYPCSWEMTSPTTGTCR